MALTGSDQLAAEDPGHPQGGIASDIATDEHVVPFSGVLHDGRVTEADWLCTF
jgi:hypothetical protein